MEEIWKDIDGYEGLYQVSNFGNVKRLDYRFTKEDYILTPKINKKGYLWVALFRDSKYKCFLIHRLVGNAFIPNSDGLPFINHKDEDRTNNRVENLEWCTPSYNVRYSLERHPQRHKNRPRKIGGKVSPYKHKSKVIQLSKDGEQIKIWNMISEITNETNWRGSSIVEVCEGNRKSAYGYIWRFANDDISVRENAI